MDDPKEIPGMIPVDASGPTGHRRSWRDMLRDLERERDELRVKLHLAKAEARDEWARLETRYQQLREKSRGARSEAGEAMEDIGDAAQKLWSEVKEGYDRIRQAMR